MLGIPCGSLGSSLGEGMEKLRERINLLNPQAPAPIQGNLLSFVLHIELSSMHLIVGDFIV